MSKAKYLSLCMSQPVWWLEKAAANPTDAMRRIHVALIRIAIRRKTGRA